MNRSYNSNSYNYGWRNPALQEPPNGKILDLLEKIRGCKPYLQKRLKIIEESGQLKLLREEVKDICQWLDIAQDVRADIIYGVDTLEVVHEKMMEMIRLHPMQEAFTSKRGGVESDEDNDSAPRSPSPGPGNNDFSSSSTRIIPLEKAPTDDWSRSNEFLKKPSESPPRRPGDRSFESRRHDSRFNDWSPASPPNTMEFSRRGDTDMRYDNFAGPTKYIGRGRALGRNVEEPRVGTPDSQVNSPWNGGGSSPWETFQSNSRDPKPRSRERSDDSSHDFDYRNRSSRDHSPGRGRFREPRERPRDEHADRGRNFFKDQDLRDFRRNRDRSREREPEHSRDRDRESSEKSRSRTHYRPGEDRDWPRSGDRLKERSVDRDRSTDSRSYDYRDSRDSNNRDPRNRNELLGDDNSVNNRDIWAIATESLNPRASGMSGNFNSEVSVNPFMLNQSVINQINSSPNVNMMPVSQNINHINLNRQQNLGMLNRGIGLPNAHTSNIPQNTVIGSRNSPLNVGLGPHSPQQFPNPFAPPHANSPRQPLLPTPVNPPHRPPSIPTQHFSPPYQSPVPTTGSIPRQLNPNVFDPVLRQPGAADFADQFRQKAQQHFSKTVRPRPPPPRPAGPTCASARPPVPPLAGSNTIANPNLATNQIVADLPSDPRRRSQLQRQMQQQQSQASSTANTLPSTSIAPGDPRRRSPTKEKEKPIEKSGTSSADTSTDNSPTSANKKRDAVLQNQNSPLKQTLKSTADRVREAVAKEVPKTSKLQELRKSLSKQGFHRLGTKGKNAYEEVELPDTEHDKETTTSPTVSKHGKEKGTEEIHRNKKHDAPSSPSKSSSKDARGRSERSSRGKDRKSSQNSEEDESERKKRTSSATKSPGRDEEDKETKRKTRHSATESDKSSHKRSPLRENRSPRKSSSEEANISSQKSILTFRIPKIKRPDPPPPDPEPEPVDIQDDDDECAIISDTPRSPSPDIPASPSHRTVSSPHHSPPRSKPSSPNPATETEHVFEKNKDNRQTENLNESSTDTERSEQSTAEPLPDKASSDTDLLLRQFMMKSLGLSGDILEHIISNPNAMEQIKLVLKTHVSEIVSKDTSDPSLAISGNSESIRRKADGDEESTADERQTCSPGPADDDDTTTRSRSMTRRKSHKRRSSLEKLHDALREMNFDAVLPLGPRRAANARGQSEEGAPSSENPVDNIAESIQTVIDNALESEKEDKNPICAEPLLEESHEFEGEESSFNPPLVKGKKGRKRKLKTKLVPTEKRRGRKPGGSVSVSAKAAIAAVSAIVSLPPPSAEKPNDGDTQELASSASPESAPAPATKRRGRKSATSAAAETPSRITPSKRIRSISGKVLRPVREPHPDGRITRSMIKPPNMQINQTLGKVKLESDFVPPIPVPKVEPIEEAQEITEDLEIPVVELEQVPDKSVKTKYGARGKSKAPKATEPVFEIIEPPLSPATKPDEVSKENVFIYDVVDGINMTDCIVSHDKLLNVAETPIVVRKIFPGHVFDDYLNSLIKAEPDDGFKRTTDISDEKLMKDCRETIDWMLSVIQFKQGEDLFIKSEERSEEFSELYQEPDAEITQPSLLVNKCSIDMGDTDDDAEDEQDDEYDFETADKERDDRSNVCDLNKASNGYARSENSDPDDGLAVASHSSRLDEDTNSSTNFEFNVSIKEEPEDNIPVWSHEDNVDRDYGRKANLDGADLYRCGHENCTFRALTATVFKDHVSCCSFGVDGKLHCFHCERRMKSVTSLLEHLKIHGKPRQLCSLCDFRGWFNSEVAKHLKNTHKVYNCKIVTEGRGDEDPVNVAYPKEVASKLTVPHDLLQNHILYTSKVQFRPSEIDSIPKASVFTSLLHCAVCEYATKVRSNIVRHLELHSRSEKDGGCTPVPNRAPVNPVPCLERKELMFDKMTNWAGSSHTNKMGSVSKEDTLKLPKFVVDQFRYVCCVTSCQQITGQDDILCSHMKTLHGKEKYYVCPHCQEEEGTRLDERNTVLIEKIPHHLKLHGPRLSKCGHCDYIHYSSASMEKHVATKHVEKKPIFYLIRDLDSDGNTLNRRTSADDSQKGTHERWRCNLCKSNLGCWEEAKSHCNLVHKLEFQFECSYCHYGSDSIYAITAHINDKGCRSESIEAKILIAFLRNEAFESSDTKVEDGSNIPIWRRDAPRVKHIRGIFLDDEITKIASNAAKSSSQRSVSSLSSPTNNVILAPPKVPSAPPPLLVCPKCNLFKAKSAQDLKIHLFNELNYQRYKCTICEIRFVTVDSLKAHMNLDHKLTIDDESKVALPTNEKIETQVYEMISNLLNTQRTNYVDDKDGRNVENLLCKHCYTQFSSYHNYRTHILAKHIGSERFRCKHCNIGFWHEAIVKQHHQKTHGDKLLAIVRNNDFEQKLTPDFWFREYGIPRNKSAKSTSIGRVEDEEGSFSPTKYLKCNHCDFRTDSIIALQNHEVSHSVEANRGKRRSIASSDTDKEESDDPSRLSGLKRPAKNHKELSTVYKCGHCGTNTFTKRGIRSHWSKVHATDELPCRYFECKSVDDNCKLTDGYILKCSTCAFQTSSVEHFQHHHDIEHPGKIFRFKRRKRNENQRNNCASGGAVEVFICNHCFCELDSMNQLSRHNQTKHPESPESFKVTSVQAQPASESHENSSKKLIEENAVFDCSSCHKMCGTINQYVSHFTMFHASLQYLEPIVRFTRVYNDNNEGSSDTVNDNAPALAAPAVKVSRLATQSSSSTKSQEQLETENGSNNTGSSTSNNILKEHTAVMYVCPKCDFKSEDYELLCNNHLVTHLLAYRCPECNLAFHLLMDAQFHIRHFHGIPRIRASHNGDAYLEFSSLKEKITKMNTVVPVKNKNVIVVTLSDEDDFDDTPSQFPMPTPDDLDELDADTVQLVLNS